MPKNSLCFLLALLAGIAIPLANRAKADDCEGQCYAALTYYMHCKMAKVATKNLGLRHAYRAATVPHAAFPTVYAAALKFRSKTPQNNATPPAVVGPLLNCIPLRYTVRVTSQIIRKERFSFRIGAAIPTVSLTSVPSST